MDNASVWCYGSGRHSAFGAVALEYQETPLQVLGLPEDVAAIASGEMACWGESLDGQLGIYPRDRYQTTPLTVEGLDGIAVAISTGARHTCALLDDATARCWGENSDGRLGAGFMEECPSPTAVVGF